MDESSVGRAGGVRRAEEYLGLVGNGAQVWSSCFCNRPVGRVFLDYRGAGKREHKVLALSTEMHKP